MVKKKSMIPLISDTEFLIEKIERCDWWIFIRPINALDNDVIVWMSEERHGTSNCSLLRLLFGNQDAMFLKENNNRGE